MLRCLKRMTPVVLYDEVQLAIVTVMWEQMCHIRIIDSGGSQTRRVLEMTSRSRDFREGLLESNDLCPSSPSIPREPSKSRLQ